MRITTARTFSRLQISLSMPRFLALLLAAAATSLSFSGAFAQTTDIAESRRLREAGDYAGAERALGRANSPEALFERARIPMAQGDYRASRSACGRLRSAHRDSPYVAICDARAFLVWNRSARAMTALESVAQNAGSQSVATEVALAEALAHRLVGEREVSEAAYRRALELDESRAEAHRGLGQLYVASGNREGAIRELRRAVELSPSDQESRLALAELTRGQAGIQTAREVSTAQPNNIDAWLLLGELSNEAGDSEEAARAFQAVLDRQEGHGPALRGLGMARLAQGQVIDARVLLSRAAELNPSDASIVMALGRLAEDAEEFTEAYRHYQHASALNPSVPDGYFAAAQLAHAQRRNTLATGYLDRLFARHPNYAPALELYGDALVQMRNNPEARRYYERAIAAGGDRARIQAKLNAAR